MKKFGKIMTFALLALLLGIFAGTVIWVILKIISIGTAVLWQYVPDKLGLERSLIYNLAVCMGGGVLIGRWQKRYGMLPDSLEYVMDRIRNEGAYPYSRLHIIAVAAVLPLIFGGALGPEAGLAGIIVGMCYMIGDHLKYKADEVAALAESGISAVLGAVFGAPLFGIIGNLEYDGITRKNRMRLVSRKIRILLYVLCAAGALGAMYLLSAFLGGAGGLPRFERFHETGLSQWKWFIPLLVTGAAFGLFFLIVKRITTMIGDKMGRHRVLSCVTAGFAVAVTGYFMPLSMFSGEHQMYELMDSWQEMSVVVLIFSAVCKIFLTNLCINLGWRGGNIFPLIFSGVAVGYSVAAITGMDGSFAVAVTAAALYAYVVRKPLTVAAVLLLCFPVTYILPILAASFAASKIPVPRKLIFKKKKDMLRRRFNKKAV